jgi:hypothetical protein
MDSFKSTVTGSMTNPLIILIILMVFGIFMSTRLKESALISKDKIPEEKDTKS